MLHLTTLTRIAADVSPVASDVLLNEHVITKVEAHDEAGVAETCIKVYSDELPPMVCVGTVKALSQQLAENDRQMMDEVVAPLHQTIEALSERVGKLEDLFE